jgi:hypothetical protein
MPNPLAGAWLYNTVRIENDWHEFGTGFLVARNISATEAKVFLVTNKHVLNSEPKLRAEAEHIQVFFNYWDENGRIAGRGVHINLSYTNGDGRIWEEHPDSDVDVLVLDLTALYLNVPNSIKKVARYNVFADADKLNEFDIDIGDHIYTLGYPKGLGHGVNYLPIARGGIIATQIGQPYMDIVATPTGPRQRYVRGFLIDGGILPGSSGSPVILGPKPARFVNGTFITETPTLLLGIVAETHYAPIKNRHGYETETYAGLGLAFDAATIRETIELAMRVSGAPPPHSD